MILTSVPDPATAEAISELTGEMDAHRQEATEIADRGSELGQAGGQPEDQNISKPCLEIPGYDFHLGVMPYLWLPETRCPKRLSSIPQL